MRLVCFAFGVANEDVDDGLAGWLWEAADAGSAVRRGCSCRQGMLGLTRAGRGDLQGPVR